MVRAYKPIAEQVIVITGATSGIGLTTARMAAGRGARLALLARNHDDLQRLRAEIESEGGEVVAVAGDVADPTTCEQLAQAAIERFGGFDTWVNNAGISIYGRLSEVPLHEKRRLFDVDFWGVVHGCRVAVPHLKRRGGVIINLGSVVSDRAIPLQGIYSAAKHAVKAYTDALRMELEEEGAPVAVTLIKPAAIDTPYLKHARNHMAQSPKLPQPVYAPEAVARAIIACAQHPRRDVAIGAGAKLFAMMEKVAPRTTDRYMEKTMFRQQQSSEQRLQEDALFAPPAHELEQRSGLQRLVQPRSIYTDAALHPWAATGALTALAALGLGIWALTRSDDGRRRGTNWKDYLRRSEVISGTEM